jgi:hypothetical protein
VSKVEPERGFNNKNHENKTILYVKLNNDVTKSYQQMRCLNEIIQPRYRDTIAYIGCLFDTKQANQKTQSRGYLSTESEKREKLV